MYTSTEQNLTFEYIQNVFRKKGMEYKPQALDFYTKDQKYTNTALLMSDQNPFTVKIAVFFGTNVFNFKDRKEVEGSVVRQLDVAMEYMSLNNPVRTIITGNPQHQEFPSYPEAAVREAFLNAICHRSYFSKSPIQIEFFDDRMTIMSPGPIRGGLSVKAIVDGQTYQRNSNVAKVLHKLEYIENYGTGIRRILDSYQGSELEPDIAAGEDHVKITLPNLNYQNEENVEVKDNPIWHSDDPNIDQIMTYLEQHQTIKRGEVEQLLKVNKSQAGEYIKKLIDSNLVKKIGSGPATRYQIYKKS